MVEAVLAMRKICKGEGGLSSVGLAKVWAGRAPQNAIRCSLAARQPLSCVDMSDTLVVNEIYLSLQGESTFAGLPCVFVRLTACDLRCSYCDTAYAFSEGKKRELGEVRAEVLRLAKPHSAFSYHRHNHQGPSYES